MHAGSWRMIASSIERKRSASLSISCRCCLAARRRCSITMAHQRRRGTRNRTQKATVIYCMASRLGFGASDGQAALKLSVAPIVPFVRLVSHKVTVAVLVVSDIVIDIGGGDDGSTEGVPVRFGADGWQVSLRGGGPVCDYWSCCSCETHPPAPRRR